MDIAQIIQLEDGVSGISCSGVVAYAKEASRKIGEYNGKPYDFWTQFIVVKDSTGDIGVNLNLGNESYLAVRKDSRVSVEKGTVTSYTDSKQNLRKSLKASLVVPGKPIQGQQQTQKPQEKPSVDSNSCGMGPVEVAGCIKELIQEMGKFRREILAKGKEKARTIKEYKKQRAISLAVLSSSDTYELDEKTYSKPPATFGKFIAEGIVANLEENMVIAESDYKACICNLEALGAELNGYQSIYRHLDET